jgi:hypothetical protein
VVAVVVVVMKVILEIKKLQHSLR